LWTQIDARNAEKYAYEKETDEMADAETSDELA